MDADYLEPGGDRVRLAVALRRDGRVGRAHLLRQNESVPSALARIGARASAREVRSVARGREWDLVLVADASDDVALERDDALDGAPSRWVGALLPPSPFHHEGGPDAFAHYSAPAGVLRMQCFLMVEREEDGAVATVPLPDDDEDGGTLWYLPACNLARLEHPHHAARRIARDWFSAPLPDPEFAAALSFPGSGSPDDASFFEWVFKARLPPGHPVASLDKLSWSRPGAPPPGPMFVDQASVFARLPRATSS